MNREYNPCINTGGGGELYAYKCTHNIHLHYHDNKCVLKILCVPLLSPGKKNKVRVYYLAWLRNKILHNDPEVEKKQGWTTVGEMEGCVHYKVGEWVFFFQNKSHKRAPRGRWQQPGWYMETRRLYNLFAFTMECVVWYTKVYFSDKFTLYDHR